MLNRWNVTGRLFVIIGILFLFISCKNKPLFLEVPYVTTPDFVVDKMMQMAHVEPGDYVIDLGSGDGRIVIAAAQLGAFGHGVDIDPERNVEARQNAIEAGVEDKVMFRQENIFRTDISKASVVTMFLLTTINRELRPRLFDMLEPGTRVVSHKFDMGEWEPDGYAPVTGPDGTIYEVFLWIMPAQIEGEWRWTTNQKPFTMEISEEFQEVELTITANMDTLEVLSSNLRGKQFEFSVFWEQTHYQFWGEVNGDTVQGYVQIEEDNIENLSTWTAVRNPS